MKHQFVEFIPEKLEPDTLYVSLEFDTAVHLCACGCGHEIVTPLSPADWSLMYDGRTVSLSPSIGNWSYPCRSHYYVWKGRIEWAPKWSRYEIETGRRKDHEDRQRVFRGGAEPTEFKGAAPLKVSPRKARWPSRVIRWISGKVS